MFGHFGGDEAAGGFVILQTFDGVFRRLACADRIEEGGVNTEIGVQQFGEVF
jgi:hypothetical protein